MKSPEERENLHEGRILELLRGREHELYSTQDITDSSRLMYPAYNAALIALEGILTSSRDWNGKRESQCDQKNDIWDLYGYANNVLAFCADRGQGKTSAMLSFSNALESYSYDSATSDILKLHLDKSRFFVLPPIDPTMLTNRDSVLELILARLLDEFTKVWESTGAAKRSYAKLPAVEEHDKFKVLTAFNECRDGLHRNMEKPGKSADQLLDDNDAFNIKTSLLTIIRSFFISRGWDVGNSFLVIQLDDTDMQFENAYQILEEVRKYLSIPNTVVLMATYLKQLRALVELHYRKVFDEKGNWGVNFSYARMAAKYIDKLIPAAQAIHLPSIERQWEANSRTRVSIKDRDTNTNVDQELEDLFFGLIYDKTGLAFIKHDSYIHDIMPSTLRGTFNLYRLLDRMEGIDNTSRPEILYDKLKNKGISLTDYADAWLSNSRKRLNNLRLFENYFMSDWVPSRLDADSQKIFDELEQIHSNRRIRMYIDSDWQETGKKNEESIDFTYIGLLDYMKKTELIKESDFRRSFALHLYFSIQLNKFALIDEITFLEKWLEENAHLEKSVMSDVLLTIQYQNLYLFLTGKTFDEGRKEDRLKKDEELKKLINRIEQDNKTSATSEYEKEERRKKMFNILKYLVDFLPLIDISKGSVVGGATEADADGEENEGKESKKIDYSYILLQQYLVYICCNWDVQHQLIDNMSRIALDNQSGQGVALFSEFDELLKQKNAVGPVEKQGEQVSTANMIETLHTTLGKMNLQGLGKNDGKSEK